MKEMIPISKKVDFFPQEYYNKPCINEVEKAIESSLLNTELVRMEYMRIKVVHRIRQYRGAQ